MRAGSWNEGWPLTVLCLVLGAGCTREARHDDPGIEIEATENASENSLPATRTAPEPATIEMPEGTFLARPEALHTFYGKLAARLRGERNTVRIAHYGDSLIASDFLSGTARRLMQDRFVDGGHGFVLVANPWAWYFHNDVWHVAGKGWHHNRVSGPYARDGAYGPGGVVFRGAAGASAQFGTAPQGDYGRQVSQFQVLYAARPGGGALELRTAAGVTVLETDAEQEAPKVAFVAVPDGEAKLGVRVLRGEVKLYGVALERDHGLVYDAYGVLGAPARAWLQMHEEHWRAAYEARPPSLVVVQYGTNETVQGAPNYTEYEEQLTTLLRRWRQAAPDASLLLAAPPDRAEKAPGGGWRSHRALSKLIAIQRRVAEREGVAFFDTVFAMGGEGAMGRWLTAKPPLCSTDLIHPTAAGSEALGRLFVRGLLDGYKAWQKVHDDAPELPET